MQIVFKTKNDYCREKAVKCITALKRKASGCLQISTTPVDPNEITRGLLVTIDGLLNSVVLIGGVDGSYIQMMWMKDGQCVYADIDLSLITRIISL